MDVKVTRARLATGLCLVIPTIWDISLEDRQRQWILSVPGKMGACHYKVPWEGFLYGSLHLNGARASQITPRVASARSVCRKRNTRQ